MRRTTHALAVETHEVPVISNETLEAHVVSIRTDLADLKADFRAVVARIDHDIRAMAAKAESEIKTAVVRIDEQFREVRQDIRELRAENKTLRDKIDGNYAALDKKIDTKFEEARADIKEVRTDIKELCGSISDLKSMQKAILWLLGSVSLIAAIVTIAKTLHWM